VNILNLKNIIVTKFGICMPRNFTHGKRLLIQA
jgi:hypothetical protein